MQLSHCVYWSGSYLVCKYFVKEGSEVKLNEEFTLDRESLSVPKFRLPITRSQAVHNRY